MKTPELTKKKSTNSLELSSLEKNSSQKTIEEDVDEDKEEDEKGEEISPDARNDYEGED